MYMSDAVHRARFCRDKRRSENVDGPEEDDLGVRRTQVKLDLYRVLRSVVERFEDLSHLSSGPEMHPEAGHSTASGQADHAGTHTHTHK